MLGHALMTGAESMPAKHDDTRLQQKKRQHGRPQKAGDRYTKLAEDDVDINTQVEVPELEALLSQQSLTPKKTRRIMRKTSGA